MDNYPDNQGMQAPHGPVFEGEIGPMRSVTYEERQIFDGVILPNDSYDGNGTYWADMPLGQRLKFVHQYDSAETKREFGNFLTMFKSNPLRPVGWYFKNYVLAGAGLGLEGYVLFSIGNITPLFEAKGAYPQCWSKYTECNVTWVYAVTYLEIIGIIVGQILVGWLGDKIGRRYGLLQDAFLMLLGLIMLTSAWAGDNLNGWVIFYAWSLFVYGVGVGGEYPMTATSSMENAVGSGRVSTKEDRLHRGRRVTSAFLMQGWGQFLNQALLLLLLAATHHGTGVEPYGVSTVQATYRISFAIPAIGTAWLLWYRWKHMRTADRQLQKAKAQRGSVTGYDVESLKYTVKYFGSRLVATAGGWFANDVFFYGNKLFQSDFIKVISPDSSNNIIPLWTNNMINVTVSLVGYYLASFLIDNKLYGRRNMQIVGFLMCFITFVIPAFNYDYFKSPAGVAGFQALYYFSSFFNQFGPNSVTFLVAAEVYPTPIRASAHGFSAACGKLGALLAAVLYNYIDTQTKFYVVPWFGLLGMAVTVLFLPDTTGLDLKEQERRWKYITTGREAEYHGAAVHPHHLSMWERWMGAGKYYNAELDYSQRVDELEKEWEAEASAGAAADAEKGKLEVLSDGEIPWTPEMAGYFQRKKTGNSPEIRAMEKNGGNESEGSSNGVTTGRQL